MATNEYGLDVAYFTDLFKRELSSINNYKPDELARVLLRAAVTADAAVLSESEFRRHFNDEKQIRAELYVADSGNVYFKPSTVLTNIIAEQARNAGIDAETFVKKFNGPDRLVMAKLVGMSVAETFADYDHPQKDAYIAVASDMVFHHILAQTAAALTAATVPEKYKETHHVLLAEINNALHNS